MNCQLTDVIILGDFNASLHARKADEDQHIGNNILGKGLQFLYKKEAAAGNVTLNRVFNQPPQRTRHEMYEHLLPKTK